jgi:hypothetical protein
LFLQAELRLPSATESALIAFAQNPLSIISTSGISIQASASLPFGLGQLTFSGIVSSSAFDITAAGSMGISPFQVSAALRIAYSTASSALLLSFTGPLPLPLPFGQIQVSGTMTHNSFTGTATIQRMLFSVGFCGTLSVSSGPPVQVQLIGYAQLGFLGRFDFNGIISSAARILLSASTTTGWGASNVGSMVTAITETLAPTPPGAATLLTRSISDAVTMAFQDTPLSISRTTLNFDTQASSIGISITMSVFGATRTMTFSLPLPGGRRLASFHTILVRTRITRTSTPTRQPPPLPLPLARSTSTTTPYRTSRHVAGYSHALRL